MSQDFSLIDPQQKPVAGLFIDLAHWASNAIAIWPMWEGAGGQIEDVSGNGHAGTISNLSNGASFNGEGLVFGGGGGIKLASIPQLSAWSWVAIINPQTQPNPYGNLISVSSNRGIWINSGKIDFFSTADHLANTTLKIGIDQYVAVTCDATGLAHFYYNGNSDGFAFTSAQNFPFDGMGGDAGLSGEPYKGQMKLVMLFDYVLSADQIKELYERPYAIFSKFGQGRLVKLPARSVIALIAKKLLGPFSSVWGRFKGIFS